MPTPNPRPTVTPPAAADAVQVQLIGGPTVLIGYGGLRLLTDPTFDSPGEYPIGSRSLVKTMAPAVGVDELGAIDAVLLSHDQHPDNLDHSGRALLATVPLTLSTNAAAERLGDHVTGLDVWAQHTLRGADGREVQVTAAPAQHGPDGTEHLTGPVTGFILTGDGLPTVYVSGDNASLDAVTAIAARFAPVDVAVLHGGGARTALMDADLTLGSDDLAQAAVLLDAAIAIPVHTEGWQHFRQGPNTVAAAFERRGEQHRLALLAPGECLG